MRTRIRTWGNSLAVRIPIAFAKEAGMRSGTTVRMNLLKGGKLELVPLARAEYRLDDLLRRVDDRNLHGEESTGRKRGREAW